MIRNLLLVISATLNLTLGWFIYDRLTDTQISQSGTEVSLPGQPSGVMSVSPQLNQDPDETGLSGSPDESAPDSPAALAVTGDLTTDYRDFAAYLREQGYDEALIRQILLATINRDHLLEKPVSATQTWWKRDNSDPTATVQQDLDWQASKRLMLVDLFGDAVVNDPLFEDLFKPMNSTLPFLSSDKQIRIHELQELSDAENREMFRGGFTAESREERLEQRADMLSTIQQILSPDEFTEYQLRESRLASVLTRSMAGMDYSEQDFRDIYAIRAATEGSEFQLSREDGDFRKTREISNQRIRDYLGNERYKEYQRSTDPAYRSLQSIGERYGNSIDEINQVYDIREETELAVLEIRQNQSLDGEARREQVEELRAAAREKIAKIAGEETAASIDRNARRLQRMSGRFR
ncbi:MAG: hypothetical protein KDI36_08540 [Pseudomonadales bacterium]|nr:hypothetical protein [Pseudomonadales bacterium]